MKHAIMANAFAAVACAALLCALIALSNLWLAEFAIAAALFLVATLLDLRVHRRGPYRERSAVLLFIAFMAIVVTGVFAQVGVTA